MMWSTRSTPASPAWWAMRGRQVPVTLATGRSGKHRAEAPVLPAREALVGRRTHRHPVGEQGLAGPRIVAVRVAAHRQVESQAESVVVEALPQIAELAARQCLGHEVKALLLGIHLIGRQGAGRARGRPVPPVPAEPDLRAAEPRVADQLLVQLRRRSGPDAPRGRREPRRRPGSRPGRRGRPSARWASPRSRISSDQNSRLTGEYGLGSGDWVLKVGSQGERRDQVAAPLSDPAAEGLEVPEVAEGSAPCRAEGGQMSSDAPAPMRSRPAPRLARRGDDRARLAPARDLDREAVVAAGKWLGRPNPPSERSRGTTCPSSSVHLCLDAAIGGDLQWREGLHPRRPGRAARAPPPSSPRCARSAPAASPGRSTGAPSAAQTRTSVSGATTTRRPRPSV